VYFTHFAALETTFQFTVLGSVDCIFGRLYMLIKGRAERVSLERVSWVQNHARSWRTACYATLSGTENSDSLTCTLIANFDILLSVYIYSSHYITIIKHDVIKISNRFKGRLSIAYHTCCAWDYVVAVSDVRIHFSLSVEFVVFTVSLSTYCLCHSSE